MRRYPIELDLAGRSALVVGLGAVGRSRAKGLVAAGARVVAVDPAPIEPILGVSRIAEPYRPEHLGGMNLAFAAATSEVNLRVVADARAAGVWVNSATEGGSGDFLVPASWRDGPIGLSVSTSGASPALARTLRDRAARAIGPGAAALASILLDLRREVHATVADPDVRRRIFARWGDPQWLDLAESEGPDAVRRVLRAAAEVNWPPPGGE